MAGNGKGPPDLVVERSLPISRGREMCSLHDVERVDLTGSVEAVEGALWREHEVAKGIQMW